MIPIALLVDDGCPLIHVYRHHHVDVHHDPPLTRDGRELAEYIPNAFLADFCALCERWGMAGKFSIVPAPAARGDIVGGVAGFPPAETHAWLQIARQRLGPRFDFSPEGITHNLTLDLAAGAILPLNESEWSQTQTRATLTPYLTRQLELLKTAGVDATGFTSPWVFGIQVEAEYIAAMVAAQRAVYEHDSSWYFLHTLEKIPGARPWVACRDERGRLISIPATVPDLCWETIDDASADAQEIARRLYTHTAAVAAAGGIPTVLTHWQSLFSNGLQTGLRVFEQFARLIAADGRFQWRSCSELSAATPDDAADPRSAAVSRR